MPGFETKMIQARFKNTGRALIIVASCWVSIEVAVWKLWVPENRNMHEVARVSPVGMGNCSCYGQSCMISSTTWMGACAFLIFTCFFFVASEKLKWIGFLTCHRSGQLKFQGQLFAKTSQLLIVRHNPDRQNITQWCLQLSHHEAMSS